MDETIEAMNNGTIKAEKKHFILSGYNGADEDEIMDKVINEYSTFALDSTLNKTSQKLLSKEKARRAGEVILEAAHKLKEDQVPAWMDAHFEDSWKAFDQNNEGWLRYEECHTFMRHLIGRLNKFNVAPGSIADLSTGGAKYKVEEATANSTATANTTQPASASPAAANSTAAPVAPAAAITVVQKTAADKEDESEE